ncbi:hypothetical protein Tco_1007852, partial [Tanacetum coccineum]
SRQKAIADLQQMQTVHIGTLVIAEHESGSLTSASLSSVAVASKFLSKDNSLSLLLAIGWLGGGAGTEGVWSLGLRVIVGLVFCDRVGGGSDCVDFEGNGWGSGGMSGRGGALFVFLWGLLWRFSLVVVSWRIRMCSLWLVRLMEDSLELWRDLVPCNLLFVGCASLSGEDFLLP